MNSYHSKTSVDTQISSEDLQNVDQIGRFLNKYSLYFKNEDYEHEWKLMTIKGRKWIKLICTVFCVFQDIVWTIFLMETSLIGKIERGIMDLIMFIAWYKVFVKKETALNYLSDQNTFHNNKIAQIRKESC